MPTTGLTPKIAVSNSHYRQPNCRSGLQLILTCECVCVLLSTTVRYQGHTFLLLLRDDDAQLDSFYFFKLFLLLWVCMCKEKRTVSTRSPPTLIRWWRKTYRPLKSNHISSWRLFSYVRVALFRARRDLYLIQKPSPARHSGDHHICHGIFDVTLMPWRISAKSNRLLQTWMRRGGQTQIVSCVRVSYMYFFDGNLSRDWRGATYTDTSPTFFGGISRPDPPSLL